MVEDGGRGMARTEFSVVYHCKFIANLNTTPIGQDKKTLTLTLAKIRKPCPNEYIF